MRRIQLQSLAKKLALRLRTYVKSFMRTNKRRTRKLLVPSSNREDVSSLAIAFVLLYVCRTNENKSCKT